MTAVDEAPARALPPHPAEDPRPPRTTAWWVLLGLAVLLLAASGTAWIASDSRGDDYAFDETVYVARSVLDREALLDGPVELARELLRGDAARPPGYRVVALPVTLLAGASHTADRAAGFVAFGISLAVLALAARRVAGRWDAGVAVTVLVLALSPVAFGSSIHFGTEAPTFLGLALLLWALAGRWDRPGPSRADVAVLAAAVVVCGLAKVTVLAVAVGMIGLTGLLVLLRRLAGPSLRTLLLGGGLGLALLAPLYALNLGDYLDYARGSAEFTRHALGLGDWGAAIAQTLLGRGTLVVLTALVVAGALAWRHLPPTTRWLLVVLGAGAVVLPASSTLGDNQNIRLLAPALVPLAVAAGVLARATGWTRGWRGLAVGAVLAAQLVVLVAPTPGSDRYQDGDRAADHRLYGNETSQLRRSDTWAWDDVEALATGAGVEAEAVALFGNAPNLSPQAVQLAWDGVVAERLFQAFGGPDLALDWDRIMAAAAEADVVVTAPGVAGSRADRNDADNAPIDEFVERMRAEFGRPESIEVGDLDPQTLLVWFPGDAR